MSDPRKQMQGRAAKAAGTYFETRIDNSLVWYRAHQLAMVEKTPEPMHVLRRLSNGQFVCCFEKKAQPDYKGALKGGQSVAFEAKYTTGNRIAYTRVLDSQARWLDDYLALGAYCFVVVGFSSGFVYRIPWTTWRDMKSLYGRKYILETELAKFRVQEMNGILRLI